MDLNMTKFARNRQKLYSKFVNKVKLLLPLLVDANKAETIHKQ